MIGRRTGPFRSWYCATGAPDARLLLFSVAIGEAVDPGGGGDNNRAVAATRGRGESA